MSRDRASAAPESSSGRRRRLPHQRGRQARRATARHRAVLIVEARDRRARRVHEVEGSAFSYQLRSVAQLQLRPYYQRRNSTRAPTRSRPRARALARRRWRRQSSMAGRRACARHRSTRRCCRQTPQRLHPVSRLALTGEIGARGRDRMAGGRWPARARSNHWERAQPPCR